VVLFVGTWVTDRIVEPRLGKYEGTAERFQITQLTPIERKGLRWAGITVLLFIVAIAFTVIPENGLLRHPDTGDVLRSPFFDGIIVGNTPCCSFCLHSHTVLSWVLLRNDKDMMKHIIKSMNGMGSYIVLVFFRGAICIFLQLFQPGVDHCHQRGIRDLQKLDLPAPY
jgi:aminobenzoyl-glutamate transport protein